MKFERAFATRSSLALKHLSLAQNVFVPHAKVFVCSTINVFVFYLEGGLENPRKKTKTREKSLCKTSFQLRMGLKKRTETRQR